MGIEVIVCGRQGGKTTRLIEWALDPGAEERGENRVVVCADVGRRNNLRRQFPRTQAWRVITFMDPHDMIRLRGRAARLGLDDLDLCLARMLDGYRIGAITLTDPDI